MAICKRFTSGAFSSAVCDRTSIDPSDLIYALNGEAPIPFNAHYCLPNAAQRWFYYSRQAADEALVFTTYDSHPDDGELFKPTLHTAVSKPGSENLTPRESIEVRFFGIKELKDRDKTLIYNEGFYPNSVRMLMIHPRRENHSTGPLIISTNSLKLFANLQPLIGGPKPYATWRKSIPQSRAALKSPSVSPTKTGLINLFL